MRGVWRLQRWAHAIAPKAVILLYHRVAEVASDPQLLCVSPRHFAEHLDVLRRSTHPLSLAGLHGRMALNLWLPRSVVLTFDDGYADNLLNARPLLTAADIPATVFVTAGQVGSTREFWWDELERIVLGAHALPPSLELRVGGKQLVWNLNAANGPCDPEWHVLRSENADHRQALYLDLQQLLKPMPPVQRAETLAILVDWAGIAQPGRPSHRAVNDQETVALASGGLLEIGAHTMTHSALSALPLDEQRSELVESKRRLEAILGRPVTSFSYPFGTRGDYTPGTVALVRSAGFVCACANFPGVVQWDADRYQLPRFLVRNWDGDEFSRRLDAWFHN